MTQMLRASTCFREPLFSSQQPCKTAQYCLYLVYRGAYALLSPLQGTNSYEQTQTHIIKNKIIFKKGNTITSTIKKKPRNQSYNKGAHHTTRQSRKKSNQKHLYCTQVNKLQSMIACRNVFFKRGKETYRKKNKASILFLGDPAW